MVRYPLKRMEKKRKKKKKGEGGEKKKKERKKQRKVRKNEKYSSLIFSLLPARPVVRNETTHGMEYF